ncbi:MAG: hypothetical protein IJK81_05630 [Selenomonadaceae bacterium]|nr:hypothetical protein [Selenomonadaceae bacterium]
MPYVIAFNDLHNFPVPVEIYKKFLREEWLTKKPSIQNVNINGYKIQRIIAQETIKNGVPNTWWSYRPKTREENVKILDDYLTLCEENNIRPIMFCVRTSDKYMKNFNKQLLAEFYNLIEQACQKHPSASFVDGWKWNGVTYDDFYDFEHLNINGAKKFSTYLNEFIEQLDKQRG